MSKTLQTRQEVLSLFDRLTRPNAKKEERLTELLKDPEADGTSGRHFFVPKCFNSALDISQTPRKVDGKTVTIWTQGSNFAFKKADTLYDCAKGYEVWGEALRHIRLCIQVTSATDATSQQPSIARTPGSVAFDIFVPNSDKTQLVRSASHTLTQDAFVRFLISGEGLSK
jgi:hypothetical protein